MDSEQGTFTASGPVQRFFLKVRVAVALAIIRSRPRGVSGRAHAEALAAELSGREGGWRTEVQLLRQEVLRLRQEVLIARLSRSEAGADDTPEAGSQDLFGPEGLVHADSDTPDLSLQDLVSAVTSPQPPVCAAMHPHVHFLQRLCSLQRVGGRNQGLEALWFSPDGEAGSVLVDSLCRLLDSVVRTCGGPPLGFHDPVPQACRVAAQAMDLFCSQRLPSVELKKHVEESLRELTVMLLHSNQPSRAAEELTPCLMTLGSSSLSKSFLIGHLLSQLSALAHGLWQAFQEPGTSSLEAFPLDQYQNSTYLFGILEVLLQNPEVPSRLEVETEQMGFLSHLEQRVFLLSDEFPLFCIAMWRIGRLLRE
ncbi:meiosis-specific protein MEI4 isoform X2 [Betta splendens]|uniref:Meiosis-specific protein MEI4 isoform X2 n=1 Tax=Betta splendens TaxID=158456 RepID=A0A6P7LUW7_BETSP|nr:meiosis-specific protein MEI4 isoform X2 [Betta splendens]